MVRPAGSDALIDRPRGRFYAASAVAWINYLTVKMTLVYAALCLWFPSPSVSQTTWNGLRFGMTPEQVRTHLSTFTEKRDAPSQNDVYKGPTIRLYDVPMESELEFSPTLCLIRLSFSSTDSGMHPSIELVSNVITDLKSKYGEPIKSSPDTCTARTSSSMDSCIWAWSHEGQLIQLLLMREVKDPTRIGLLTIVYRPVSKDL